ncbi:hypothetical protein Tco_0814369 [Tanacetum coccineum]
MNIITNHPLRSSASVPWIYMAQFWHTLREDGSKYRLKFMLDRKELTCTLDDFRTIFHLPQANENNHASFVPPPSFSDMVPFYKQVLGFSMELKSVSNFKISGLLQPWQTLCKIFSKCLTTRVTGWDQPPLQIVRARDAYHNLQDDDIMKNIFNSGRNKNKVGMRIPPWMITEEMKLAEHYKMYAEVFGLDVPLIQSQPTESTQETHRTTSAPRSHNPATEPAESMPTTEKANEMILQDTIQVSLAEHKSREEQEARKNVALVDEHLAAEENEKLVEESENVDDSSPPRHDDTSIPGTRLEPRSDKESPEVEIVQEKDEETSKDTEVEPNIVIPVNVDDEEDEITDEVFELRRRAKGKNVEESRISPIPSPTRSPRNLSTLVSPDTEKLQELTVIHSIPSSALSAQISSQIQNVIDNAIPSLVDASVRSYMSGHILISYRHKLIITSVPEQQHQLYPCYEGRIPLLQQDIAIWLALQMKFEKTHVPHTACRPSAIRPRDQDDPHDDADPEGENIAKRQKTSKYEAYVSGESSSGQVNIEEPGPSTSGNQEQDDEFDFWTNSYASNDDEIPTKQVLQDIIEEISLTIDEAKLKNMADEMLRQRCTLGDKHQYHIDQMKNFLQSDIVWESRKEILISPRPRKITPLKGNSGPKKIVLSLHKFPAIIFNDDDIEERTSRWVNKCMKEFNSLCKIWCLKNWQKSLHANNLLHRDKAEKNLDDQRKKIYSNSKIGQVIKIILGIVVMYIMFITEFVARRANDCIVSITEPDYKNINKNDIKDMYLLIMNNKVLDYADTGLLWSLSVFIKSLVIWERVHEFQLGIESYQRKINLIAPTITFPRIEECDVFSIVYEPVHGIIYTNSKKEKRVMRPSEIHKFCDATLRRTLEGLKSYYNDVKYGYVQKELTNDELEFLKLFEEEIEVRLKYRDQMRRWEMYVNGRPLGPRRERPE